MEQTVNGTVENIVYKNSETGFCVLDLDVSGDLVTVVGELGSVCEGEQLIVYGEFVTHRSFGRQFKAVAAERILPKTATAIQRYLENGAVKGVGKVTAKRLVEMFAEHTLDIMAREPERMVQVKGISAERAVQINKEFLKIYGMRETLNALGALGLELGDSLELFKNYADAAPMIIGDNPYMLCGEPLYKPFEFADELACARGVEPTSPKRVYAGLVHALRHNLLNGHSCLPSERLIDVTSDFLELERDTVEIMMYDFIEKKQLREAVTDGQARTFLCDMYAAERYAAERLRLLKELSFGSDEDVEAALDEFQKNNDIIYAPLQRQAIAAALEEGAVVITGGPGTGKTTAVNAIIALCEHRGESVVLAAPTGRAAKRMREVTSHDAKTIHRLLEMDFDAKGNLKFVHDDQNKLKCDVCVVDETSMVDSLLFASLLRGLPEHCRVVLVGDSDQLPAVGAGNVLKDIIESGLCRTVELSHIFRQAAKSLIVTSAHKIVGGELPDLSARDSDFFFIEASRENAAELVVALACARLPKRYNYDPLNDIQILTPTRLGLLGTVALNDAVRERVNPRSEQKAEIRVMGNLLRVGDKVMQTKNNYDIRYTREGGECGMGVFNGDIGTVTEISYQSGIMVVKFEDRIYSYTFEQAKQLDAAYATTIHKSQGSEFDAVVLAVSDVSKKLCYRNLLYTAVTRARKLLVVVGERAIIEQMVDNDRKQLRYTGLRSFLCSQEEYEYL